MKAAATMTVVAVGAALVAAGCGGSKAIGTPASADIAATPLAAVLENPDAYDGRTVVLRGVVMSQCAALCDFVYTEGGTSATVYTPNPKPPKIPRGQPVRVTAKVHKGEQQVILTATGLEILPRKGTR